MGFLGVVTYCSVCTVLYLCSARVKQLGATSIRQRQRVHGLPAWPSLMLCVTTAAWVCTLVCTPTIESDLLSADMPATSCTVEPLHQWLHAIIGRLFALMRPQRRASASMTGLFFQEATGRSPVHPDCVYYAQLFAITGGPRTTKILSRHGLIRRPGQTTQSPE